MPVSDRRHDAEVMAFTHMFHYGILGIEKTENDIREGVKRVLDSGYILQAMDVEIIYAPLVVALLEGKITVHSPVSYPLGNLTLQKKLRDIEQMIKIGVRDSAYCLTYRNILDHRYDLIEKEVSEAVKVNQGVMTMEFNIQATLLTDNEIIDACKAIENGGAYTVKLNSGYGWGTGPEELALVKRVFGNRLDVHPSGNIRTLAQVDEFMKYDVRVIHSMAVFEITEEYLARREKGSSNE